jgi:hypothetical protein
MESLWSVPDISATWPGIRSPVVAAIVAGLVTYFIVFNLDPILRLYHHVTAAPRYYLLKKMVSQNTSTDENFEEKPDLIQAAKKWSSRAKRFEVFPRPEEGPKPSDWLLFLFAVRIFAISIFQPLKNLGVSLLGRSQIAAKPVEVRI